jgi:hypothetical protein
MTEVPAQWMPPTTNISQEDVKAKMFTFLRNFDDHIRREKEAILSSRNQWIAQNAQDRGMPLLVHFCSTMQLLTW